MVLRAFFLVVFVELGLAAVSHAGACLRQAENSLSSPKNKSACLGGTFQHAGCHSFCDKDSRDASTVTEQEKTWEYEIQTTLISYILLAPWFDWSQLNSELRV